MANPNHQYISHKTLQKCFILGLAIIAVVYGDVSHLLDDANDHGNSNPSAGFGNSQSSNEYKTLQRQYLPPDVDHAQASTIELHFDRFTW